jgi:triacylglycerol lipase
MTLEAIGRVAVVLLAGSAGLWAQATVTGKFQQFTVHISGSSDTCGFADTTDIYQTSSAVIPINKTCNGANIAAQINLQFPDTIQGTQPYITFLLNPAMTTDIKATGTWNTPNANYTGYAVITEKSFTQTCPDDIKDAPQHNLPAGISSFALDRPCQLSTLYPLNDDKLNTYTLYSTVLIDATNKSSSEATVSIDIKTEYLVGTAPVTPDPLPPPADPLTPRQTTDSRFVGGSPSKCLKTSGGPLTIPVQINRVVGATGSDGTLSDFALLTGRVVSPSATLRLPVFHRSLTGASGQAQDSVRLNGYKIGLLGGEAELTGPNEIWTLNSFDVPTSLLHFGQRNPGQAPTPGNNVIEIQVDTQSPSGQENWCTASDWAELSFNAVAPVIMIHGNGQGDDGQGGRFWAGAILGDKTRLQMPFKFISAFDDMGLVYDNSISMPTDTIVAHGNLLATLIAAKAAEFGAKHVHLVAHSKGGLDSRDFLARTIPTNFGVLSLTTLSTPHHGSAGPDYQLDAAGASALYSDDKTRTLIGQQNPPNPGTENIRVSFVENFNRTNIPLLPTHLTVDGEERPVLYQSISADANLDGSTSLAGNPTIQFNETVGIPGQGSLPDIAWAYAVEQIYRLVGSVVSTHTQTINVTTVLDDSGVTVTVPVTVVRETLSPTFILNDFAVNLNEARMSPLFVEIASVKANHSTIASPDVARIVIGAILKAQPVQ